MLLNRQEEGARGRTNPILRLSDRSSDGGVAGGVLHVVLLHSSNLRRRIYDGTPPRRAIISSIANGGANPRFDNHAIQGMPGSSELGPNTVTLPQGDAVNHPAMIIDSLADVKNMLTAPACL